VDTSIIGFKSFISRFLHELLNFSLRTGEVRILFITSFNYKYKY